MTTSIQRRINVASCWAANRIAVLDGNERYEDSFAITEEFREWITGIGEHPEHLAASCLSVPSTQNTRKEEANESDEMLEI